MNYTDYVFKKGEFIGDFERMYKESKEVPWRQDVLCNALWSNIDIEIIKRYKIDRFCEIGCGLGFFTKRIKNEVFMGSNTEVIGLDISATAICKANEHNKEEKLQYYELNLLNKSMCVNFRNQKLEEKLFNFILVKDVIWYVVDSIEIFFENLNSLLSADGYIFISQTFPEVENYYGKNTFPSAKEMSKFISEKYQFDFECIERDSHYNNRELLHLVCKNKGK